MQVSIRKWNEWVVKTNKQIKTNQELPKKGGWGVEIDYPVFRLASLRYMQALLIISASAKTSGPESPADRSFCKSLQTSSHTPFPPVCGVGSQWSRGHVSRRGVDKPASSPKRANKLGDFFLIDCTPMLREKGAQSTARGCRWAVGLAWSGPSIPTQVGLGYRAAPGRGRRLFSPVTAATQIMPPRKGMNCSFLPAPAVLPKSDLRALLHAPPPPPPQGQVQELQCPAGRSAAAGELGQGGAFSGRGGSTPDAQLGVPWVACPEHRSSLLARTQFPG